MGLTDLRQQGADVRNVPNGDIARHLELKECRQLRRLDLFVMWAAVDRAMIATD
jgi:hypothetical protein